MARTNEWFTLPVEAQGAIEALIAKERAKGAPTKQILVKAVELAYSLGQEDRTETPAPVTEDEEPAKVETYDSRYVL